MCRTGTTLPAGLNTRARLAWILDTATDSLISTWQASASISHTWIALYGTTDSVVLSKSVLLLLQLPNCRSLSAWNGVFQKCFRSQHSIPFLLQSQQNWREFRHGTTWITQPLTIFSPSDGIELNAGSSQSCVRIDPHSVLSSQMSLLLSISGYVLGL